MQAKVPRAPKNPNKALLVGWGTVGGAMLPIVHRSVNSGEFVKGYTDNMAPWSSGKIT